MFWTLVYYSDPALSITLQIYPNHAALCLDESDYVMERDKVCAYNPHWSADACQVQCRQQKFILTHIRPIVTILYVCSYNE